MDRLIYTALSGMDAAMNRQRAVANNLANASTPGFRAEELSVKPVTIKGDGFEARSLSQGAVRGANMDGGTVTHTGQPMDIALVGNALLALQASDGTEVYSRRGDLRVSATGVLENGDGLPVLGEAGPITVPAGSQLAIGEDGGVFLRDPATPEAPPELVAQIKLANPEGSAIIKDLDGFLRVPGGGALPGDPTARVIAGSLEGSNVDTATTLVQMIEAQRSFEQRTKIISTADDLDQAGARLMSLR
ncbi:flagellar basal body rod protein FlgF [Parerythrobacter jejuensis]|uniref:Flagellar basal-body rod protein FlgF n=1 Tax=Parerythrobacter jejuensis TaxID=795812 RepID=A0A845AME5_9SPHN|nr:flagellar basal body rod protein FlgF [Parerythrobacter jejuensis]MXP30597.1 flagellar hook-basal body complex protein [Parerythrobacter jejuensis]MXP33357.1 flagellar hook-basal body complex protein [Parerythrobacter jejuensis]